MNLFSRFAQQIYLPLPSENKFRIKILRKIDVKRFSRTIKELKYDSNGNLWAIKSSREN